MGRSQETFGKKEVRSKKEKKRKEKEHRRALKKNEGKKKSFDEMIAYVDEFGKISSIPPDPDKKTFISPDSIELTVTKNSSNNFSDKKQKGIVTFFNESKGFGFIRIFESGEKIFVHKNNLTELIKENNVVVFEIGKGPRGTTALNVKILRE